jgi:hypothetical protein
MSLSQLPPPLVHIDLTKEVAATVLIWEAFKILQGAGQFSINAE